VCSLTQNIKALSKEKAKLELIFKRINKLIIVPTSQIKEKKRERKIEEEELNCEETVMSCKLHDKNNK
jgi:hypothetical protein